MSSAPIPSIDPYPGWTWEALLLRTRKDPADAMEACRQVGAVQRDITADVLEGMWQPPLGRWALLVIPEGSEWATLTNKEQHLEALVDLLHDLDAETLVAGFQDTAGTLHLTHRRPLPGDAGLAVKSETDGDLQTLRHHPTASDDDEEEAEDESEFDSDYDSDDFDEDDFDPDEFDDDSFLNGTVLKGTDVPPEDVETWLARHDDASAAFEALLQKVGAVVPLFFPEGEQAIKLTVYDGCEAALVPGNIRRIDLIRFGEIPEDEPTPQQIKASRQLEAAIENDDIEAVRKALAKDSTLGALPEKRYTALWLACHSAGPGRDHDLEIVTTLLAAGSDPNLVVKGNHDERPLDHPLLRVVQQCRDDALRLDLIRALAAASSDLNPASRPGSASDGDRPLHKAASKGLPEIVELLLSLGADPLAENVHGRTPRQHLEFTRTANAKYFKPTPEELADDERSKSLLEEAEKASAG